MSQLDGYAQDIPALVIRLKTLERLHASAGSINMRVENTEALINAINSQSSANAAVLQDIKDGLATNIATMLNNIATMDKKLEAVRNEKN